MTTSRPTSSPWTSSSAPRGRSSSSSSRAAAINLTAAFSPALADTQIFVLDCAGGDDVPRKGGPGIARSDLLVINKIDLAPYVGARVELMLSDARAQRGERPIVAVSLRDGHSVEDLAEWVLGQLDRWRAGTLRSVDPGPPAAHAHHDQSTA